MRSVASPHIVEICVTSSAAQQIEVGSHLRRAALATLQHQDSPSGREMTVVLSNDEHIRQLNHKFAGEDSATDVLSFPSQDNNSSHYLGDIIISVETAERQAHSVGHELLTELVLLTVHGTLHLLGHDHDNSNTKGRMWHAQAEIRAQL